MQNKKLNFPLVFLFILPDMPSVPRSTPIYQRAYHGQTSQRWEIKMVDYMNGYYTLGKSTARSYAQQCRYEAAILFHELCHQLGAPDHYCKFESGDDDDSTAEECSNGSCDLCAKKLTAVRDCTMGYTYYLDDHTADSILCDDCKDGINSHLDDHHEEV